MEMNHKNSLGQAASAYLRSAAHQPVEWQEWGPEAFERASRENKPVLLDIGAVWCHWCHVMDRESYGDADTAALINEKFVAVKVDRDERPDVDTRYQSAVAAISGQGGWPLTAFLTPDGTPYFGGTYFPPDERYGRPSFKRVLQTMAGVFAHQRDEVNETTAGILETLEHNETFVRQSEAPDRQLLDTLLNSILSQFDGRNGGFGSQPKFLHCGAIDLLIDAAGRGGPLAESAGRAAETTLKKMAAGGIHDQLAGGFHRYSVDERWIVPHFEKLAYDNSALLKNYLHAFQTFLDPEYAVVARNIIGWMDECLSDREHGGFYSSQDADESLDDDGDYFTWTRAEAKAALNEEEFEAAALHFNLRDVGDMHHNPQKNVLHVGMDSESVARRLGNTYKDVQELLESAKGKMYAARLQRPTPFVDKAMYVGWNGMCISAYLEASRVLGLPEAKEFALRSLDRLLDMAWSRESGLSRVLNAPTSEMTRHIPAILDDYALVATAALDAWDATGEVRYFEAAGDIADHLLEHFYDPAGGGFFDTQFNEDAIDIMRVRRKPVQDAPTPAGNAVAATVLLRLSALSDDDTYERRARETLKAFGAVAEQLGLYAASYGLALRRASEPPVQVCLVSDREISRTLLAAAMVGFSVSKSVIELRPAQLAKLPPALAQTLTHMAEAEGTFALVCTGNTCLPPVHDADELARILNA